ncbi:MAG: HAD-IIB family hydrolase [Clostridia bacterium]|nr:HAD-IIB family hydrolase [Clostridia bacterium]
MGRFDGILIISDVDGTLMSTDMIVSERNRRAVSEFIKEGGAFSLATGRNKNSIATVTRQIEVNAPCVLVNGAMVYDAGAGRVMWEHFADEKRLKALVGEIMALEPALGTEIFTGSGMCVIRKNAMTELHKARDPKDYYSSPLEAVPAPLYKAILTDTPEELLAAAERLKKSGIEEKYPEFRFVFSENIFLEILPADVSKGGALSKLLSLTEGRFKKVYAAGDNFNDLELLSAADFSAATENAVDEVKKAADAIVGKSSDGAIADVIEIIKKTAGSL